MKSIHIHPSANAVLTGTTHISEDESAHFLATYERATRFTTGLRTKHVDIYLGDRDANGWLQHGIYVRKESDGGDDMFIAAIQRTPGAQSEFCS